MECSPFPNYCLQMEITAMRFADHFRHRVLCTLEYLKQIECGCFQMRVTVMGFAEPLRQNVLSPPLVPHCKYLHGGEVTKIGDNQT